MQKYTEQIAEQNNRNTMHWSRQNGIDQLIIFYFAHVLKKKKKLCVFKTLGSADYIKKNVIFHARCGKCRNAHGGHTFKVRVQVLFHIFLYTPVTCLDEKHVIRLLDDDIQHAVFVAMLMYTIQPSLAV